MLIALSWTIGTGDKSDAAFEDAADMVVMRTIGHQVLLASGDSVSRVMPVQKTGEHEYLLRFENPFGFSPDSLVKVVTARIATSTLPKNYVVEVLECGRTDVAYGFTFSREQQPIACLGRVQPVRCYEIRILFQQETSGGYYVTAGALTLMLLTGIGLWYFRRTTRRQLPVETDPVESGVIRLGQYAFYPALQLLELQQHKVQLTAKECSLLNIFARHINEIVDRDRLQKEVWEDEGVITGRSLDMFVSKLRKRLQDDPAIRLVNIHGRGYKLEISA